MSMDVLLCADYCDGCGRCVDCGWRVGSIGPSDMCEACIAAKQRATYETEERLAYGAE